MKMCGLFSGIFWGSLLVLVGAAIIAKAVFHINIPILKLFLAFLFIYIGVRILLSSVERRPFLICGKSSRQAERADKPDRDYTSVFGRGTLDLTDIVLGDKNTSAEGNAVFGTLNVRTKASIPAIIECNAVFGEIKTPDGESLSFGSRTYRNETYQQDRPHISIKINAVFGNVSISQE